VVGQPAPRQPAADERDDERKVEGNVDEVWLDANRIPHLTGETVTPRRWLHAVPGVTWLHPTPPPDKAEQEDDHTMPRRPGFAPSAHAGVVRIAGTEDRKRIPPERGVEHVGRGSNTPSSTNTEIFNIHNMTQYLTAQLIGDAAAP
jgi:hypothetical protein|tara:strand:+ start:45 stop:482 length:438 start_codon:yes stop_codon:yes gene_type:complete